MEQFVSDGDMRAAIARGGRIEKIIVLAVRDTHNRADFVPYLSTSWRRGYVAIGLWNGQGARAWRDLTRLVNFFRDELGFAGPICMHEANDPHIQKLRTILPSPGASPSGAKPPLADTPPPADTDNT